MFTGIIEALGVIESVLTGGDGTTLTVRDAGWDDLRLGESVAVNGVCLTIADYSSGRFRADVSTETLRRSTLGSLRPGTRVHLERALRLGDRMGGHWVQGHVDEAASVVGLEPEGNGVLMDVAVSEQRYLVAKGSVAVDGVSLTVAALVPDGFRVALIPFTLAKTTLGRRRVGDGVNVEFDILAKYVERLSGEWMRSPVASGEKRLSEAFLAEHGYL